MTNKEYISQKSITLFLIGSLTVRDEKNNYNKEYEGIYNSLKNIISQAEFIVAGKNDKIKIKSADIIKKMEEVHNIIIKCINQYLLGEITDASWNFKNNWQKQEIPKYDEKKENRIFYRMRVKKEEDKDYNPSDLLHIPINKRNIISNQRFSINGFPCLYASTSIYQCWEELRRPHLQNSYAAGLLFSDNINLFDLRLIRKISNEKQLIAFITRLPIIIACSIKTINDSTTFKAEYLFSQVFLHTIISKEYKIDGIIYSSMRKDYDYYKDNKDEEDYSQNENIVIPAKLTYKNVYTDRLLTMIEISQPLNFEQELIKGTITFSNKNRIYEQTILGQMEKQILSTRIKKADNPSMITLQSVSQRLKDLNKINITIK